jgi:hypothetical protein
MLLRLLAICGCLWACNAFSQVSASNDAAQVLFECAGREHASEVGLTALEQACPGVTAALERQGDLALLSHDQVEQLSANGLRQLQLLREEFTATDHDARKQLTTNSLRKILANLQQESRREQPLSWFQRFMRWLRELRGDSGHHRRSWFEDFEPSERALQITRWILIATVVVLALAVVINELRAAGVLRKRRARAAGISAVNIPLAAQDSQQNIEDAPLIERPAVLLRMIVSELTRSGLLRSDRSLTHRELSDRASFASDTQRAAFGRLSALAEALLYGRGSIPAADIDATVREGLSLHAQFRERR